MADKRLIRDIKYYLHKIAYGLMIGSIVVFSIPALFTLVDFLISGTAGNSEQISTSGVKSIIAALCVLYYVVSLIPYGTFILVGATALVAIVNLVWRTVRGHKIRLNYIVFFLLSIGLFALAYLSDAKIINFFS